MMMHRCSDNGWRNGRLALVHANEGKFKEFSLFIIVIIAVEITGSQPQGWYCLSSQVLQAKGHMEDKYTHKANV